MLRQPIRRPYVVAAVASVLLLSGFGVLTMLSEGSRLNSLLVPHVELASNPTCDPDPPANWDKLYEWEDQLPQHNLELLAPEGRNGRYVIFRNQIQMLGWNNLLNEMCVDTRVTSYRRKAFGIQYYSLD